MSAPEMNFVVLEKGHSTFKIVGDELNVAFAGGQHSILMKRLRTVITDKKLTMHSLRHRMKDKLRNTGCPEAISLAILGHSTNTVAANYGSGYALEVMREALVRVWEA
jgi:integrase